MTQIQLSPRHIIFKYELEAWDLNLHLIRARHFNYVIDTGLGSESVKPILDLIKHDGKETIVINTHFHWDHVWGNACFKDAIIISHHLCKDLIEATWEETTTEFKSFQRGKVEKRLPNLLIEDSLYFPEDGIRIFYTPGHTIDGISIYDEIEKVLNVGDNIGDTLEKLLPELDMEKEVYLQSLALYQKLDIDYLVSGHNVIVDKEILHLIW